ncbi:MAG: hypothetical protein ACOCVT_01580 [bacterium]
MKHRDVVDETSLFIGNFFSTGEILQGELLEEQVSLMGKRMQALRDAGIPDNGFNVIPTFGGDGSFMGPDDESGGLPFEPKVYHDGRVSRGNGCPHGKRFHAHMATLYARLARENPDFIWVDDDFTRPTFNQCFCDDCLARFQGGKWKRETLADALENADARADLRREWLLFHREAIWNMAATIEKAVHDVDPNVDLGYMTIGPSTGTPAGQSITRVMKILKSKRGRPGHGFYLDSQLRDISRKMIEAAQQIEKYPEPVKDIQYEYEDWPGIAGDKSVQTSAVEGTLSIMTGCNGIAMSIFNVAGQGVEDRLPVFERYSREKVRWKKMVELVEDTELAGMMPVVAEERSLVAGIHRDPWMGKQGQSTAPSNPGFCQEWLHLGTPITLNPAQACGVFLGQNEAEGLSDEQLLAFLKGSVILDAGALRELEKRELDHYTGCKPGDYVPTIDEIFTDHPMNGTDAGAARSMSFYGGNEIHPQADGVQVLANSIDRHDRITAASLTLYENEGGGRVAVLGYEPWGKFAISPKWRQMQAILKWITRDRMPVRLDRMLRVAPWFRQTADGGRFLLCLFNNSLDATGAFRVFLKSSAKNAYSIGIDGKSKELQCKPADGGLWIDIENISAWDTQVLHGE